VAVDKITYTGHDAIAATSRISRRASRRRGSTRVHDSIAPGSCSRIGNEYYKTEEELIYACADAMRRNTSDHDAG